MIHFIFLNSQIYVPILIYFILFLRHLKNNEIHAWFLNFLDSN